MLYLPNGAAHYASHMENNPYFREILVPVKVASHLSLPVRMKFSLKPESIEHNYKLLERTQNVLLIGPPPGFEHTNAQGCLPELRTAQRRRLKADAQSSETICIAFHDRRGWRKGENRSCFVLKSPALNSRD